MRNPSELVLGIGGIILGIWDVRPVIVQTSLPAVTPVDLLLAFVILMMLLVLTARAARHFFHVSGVADVARQHWPTRPAARSAVPSPTTGAKDQHMG